MIKSHSASSEDRSGERMKDLASLPKAVGIKECMKLLENGQVKKAYVANDASPHVTEPFLMECNRRQVPVMRVTTMEALGKACEIEVGAAVAVIKTAETQDL